MNLVACHYSYQEGAKNHTLLSGFLAKIPQADLIVLPECALSPYPFRSKQEAAQFAEPTTGATFEACSSVCKRLKCWLVVGFVEADHDALFNSAMVIDPTGALHAVYRKHLLYRADYCWAEAGTERLIINTGSFRFAVGICMDLNDDGFIAFLHNEAPDVVAIATNWVRKPPDEPSWALYPPRAYWAFRLKHFKGWVLFANTYGERNQTVFGGGSAIFKEGQYRCISAPKQINQWVSCSDTHIPGS